MKGFTLTLNKIKVFPKVLLSLFHLKLKVYTETPKIDTVGQIVNCISQE